MVKDWNGNTIRIKEWTKENEGDNDFITTDYTFDLAGNCTGMTNAEGETYTYNYNTLSQLESVEYDDGTSEASTYDKNGNLIEQVDRAGNIIKYYYDSINMLRTEETYNYSDPSTPTSVTKTDYGQYGTPVIVEGSKGSIPFYRKEYTYDGLGLLIEYHQYDQYSGPGSYEKHYLLENTYDVTGNLDTTSLSEGPVGSETLIKALDYDPVDQDTLGIKAAIASVWEYTTSKQDRIGRITSKYWGGISAIEYGDDGSTPPGAHFTTTYSYNDLLQPAGITSTKPGTGNLMNLVYTYDYQGNVKSWENGSSLAYYSYDGLDRLKKEDNNAGFSSPESVYYYDDIGNRVGIDHNNNKDYTDTGDKKYSYTDTYNKMWLKEIEDGTTSEWVFTYDANGNMIQKDNSEGVGDEYWFYTYDEKNRLTKVECAATEQGARSSRGEYLYDAGGLRIKKIENGKTTIYIYSGESILFEETFNTVDQGELDNPDYYESREYNVELNGQKITKYRGTYSSGWSYVLEFHLLDHLGSRQVVTDSQGNVVSGGDVEYGTFGEYEGGEEGEYSFTGKQRDSGTGLAYFNARYYDAEVGRFITVDPIRDGANWYVYCRNNPLRLVDPDGLAPGDPFNSSYLAAYDFGQYCNDDSICSGREYGSVIYSFTGEDGKTQYSYTVPDVGREGGVEMDASDIPKGTKAVSAVHSHGNYDPKYASNKPSEKGKSNDFDVHQKKFGDESCFVVTPNGSLFAFWTKTFLFWRERKKIIMDKDLPSDPNDPTSPHTNDVDCSNTYEEAYTAGQGNITGF